jgi:hypothetical protein
MFLIEGELLHQLNNSSQEKNCIIQIGKKQFKYTSIQIALISPIAFKNFIDHEKPFIIEIPSDLNLNDFISCFEQLDSLFYLTKELTLSTENVEIFSFLADFLDNRLLMKKCKKVNSNQSQQFKLSSKQLLNFSRSQLNHLVDFELFINDTKFEINFSLF